MNRRLIACLMAMALVFIQVSPVLAEDVISGYMGVPTSGTGTSVTLTDSLRVANGGYVRVYDVGGVNGGIITLIVPSGLYFQVDSGGVVDLSGVSGNGFGGSLIVNGAGTITINGTILANGVGNGAGGLISLTSPNLTIGNNAVLQAMAAGTGNGGRILLTETGGVLTVGTNARIETTGVSSAAANLITIEGQGVQIDGQIVADGTGNSAGGTVTLVANNGRVRILRDGDVFARGAGTGSGGTVVMTAAQGSTALDISRCTGGCGDSGSLVQVHQQARVNVSGNTGGTIRIGRSTSGTIVQNMNNFRDPQFVGPNEVIFGDGGNSTSITISNYNQSSDFSGSNPILTLQSNGAITATSGNNFDRIRLSSLGTGNINVTDSSGGMTVMSLDNATGTTTLTAGGGGALVVQNASGAANTTLQSDGTITATSGISLSGDISANGDGGSNDRAGAVTITNNGSTNIARVRSSSANLTASGGSADLTVSNLDVTGATSLTAGRDIIANATSNNFGSSTAATGRNINLRDNAGTFALNGINASGTLTLNTASGVSMTLANVDAAGAADIQVGGDNADITGSTNLVFRNTANINTNDDTGGDITLTADFQGATTLNGDVINVIDPVGDINVVWFQNGNSATSRITTTAPNSNAYVSVWDLKAGGQARLEVTAPKDIHLTKPVGGWGFADDHMVANSTNGGDIYLENFNMQNFNVTTSTTPWNGDTVGRGLWISTSAAGGYYLNGIDLAGRLDIATASFVSGTGNIFRNAVNINTGGNDINLINSDFQSVTENVFQGRNITVGDNSGGLNVTTLVASGTANISTANGGNLTISNAAVTGNTTLNSAAALTATNNNNFGTLTVTGNGAINLTEQGNVNINTLTNNNSAASTAISSANGSILGKGTASTDISVGTGGLSLTAGDAAGDTSSSIDANVSSAGNVIATAWGRNGSNHSILLRGSVNGNVTARHGNGGATTGNIYLGDATSGLTVNGTTAFNAAGSADVIGTGVYTGAVSGTAGRVSFTVTGGNFTSGGVTATGSTGWFGAADETMIILVRNGDILGSGYTTSGAGNMRLQAGAWYSLGSGNAIDVTGVSAAQNLALYATGTNGNRSINVGGASSVAGHITATGINSLNNWAPAPGDIDISLSSGNLTTALVWTDRNVSLTTTNGSILQNIAAHGMPGKTIWSKGPVTLTANGGANRYIDTGVMALRDTGMGGNVTAKASGDSNGNGTGISVRLYGRADGHVDISHTNNGNTTGSVHLGTSLGDPDNLNDTWTVMDVIGNTTVKADGDVTTFGSFGGPINVIGKSLRGATDKGNLQIQQILTSQSSGTAVDLAVMQGRITGGNITTVGTGGVLLQTGSLLPRDVKSYINLTNVNVGGNITGIAAGSTNGLASGNSIVITGSAGSATGQGLGGGNALGTVNMP